MFKVMPMMGEDTNNTTSNGGSYLRRRTINTQSSSVAEEEANDWEAVSSDEDESRDINAPKLTLMEQLVLLGLKDKQVSIRF
jgi:hypothetical protein